jgi:tRNA(adenine34) deaminase
MNQEYVMRLAIQEAKYAAEAGDVPVGAVIIKENTIIARAHNQVELLKDPTAHAEMIAITQAANTVGDWRLNGTTLYVTKEPCSMCAGAINLSRISTVIFGTSDPENAGVITGAKCMSGVLERECTSMLQEFFRELRKKTD